MACASTPSGRCCSGDDVASMAWDARNLISTQVEPPKIDNSSACTCDHRLATRYRACSTCLHLEDTEMAYFMGILKKPKRPRAPDPDDVVGLARDILAAKTLEAARAVARAFVGQN